MQLFKRRCEFCQGKIDRGKETLAVVKVPEFTGFRTKSFCCAEHAVCFQNTVKGTKRRNFCPSCPV